MTKPLPESTLLPKDARELLQRAARTPVTPEDPLARTKAIDKATQQIKRKYPHYFRF